MAGPSLDDMRGLRKDGQLTLIHSVIPGETGEAVDAARGELIVEGRARLSLGADGRVAACEMIADRVLRHLAGVRRSPAFCERYPVGRPAFEAAATGEPRVLTISILVYWRED